MTTCNKCGATVSDDANVCPSCGTELSGPAETTELSPTELTNEEATGAETTTPSATSSVVATSPSPSANASVAPARPASRPSVAPTGKTSSGTKAAVAIAIALVLALGLIGWLFVAKRSHNSNLSSEDMTALAEGLPPEVRASLANSEDERKEFAKNIREMFAVAEEGRKAGIADKPEMKRQLDLMRSFVIAQLYEMKQTEAGKQRDEVIPKEEMDAFLKEGGQDKKFDEFVQDVQNMKLLPPGPVEGTQKDKLRQEWARVSLLHRKGVAAGLDKDKKAQMQIRLQEARLLASEYAKDWNEKVKATDQEIDAYLAKHPELDSKETRAKAEEVLKRARAGEDFAKLAKEFSEDPSNKDKGGDLGWFSKGSMVESFETAAFALQPNQVSDIVETPFGFHIIKVQERRTQNGPDGKPEEQVHASHILFRTGSSNPMGLPQTPRDQAKVAVETEKREKLIEDIMKKSKVEVADNFQVKAPETPTQMPFPPPGAGGPPDGATSGAAGAPPVQTEPQPQAGNANAGPPSMKPPTREGNKP